MRRSLRAAGAFAAPVVLLSTAGAAPDPAPAALKAGGCPDAPNASILAPRPGGPAGEQVVAGLGPQEDDDSLGPLCVALVRASGAGFARLAKTPAEPELLPPAEVQPTTSASVAVDPAVFRISPQETAIGVRTTGDFRSTSTAASWSELYLFRVEGSRLVEIFRAPMAYEEGDAVTGQDDKAWEKVVRFDRRLTRGAYDLILAPKHGGPGPRYVWTGARYAPAPRKG